MDIGERFEVDGDKLVHIRTHDFEPALEQAAALRSAGMTGFSENWLVGTIPAALLAQWVQEAGVTMDDTGAVQEILHRKLLDGEFSKFRVHEGTF